MTDPEFRPDPGKITYRGGVLFNPWVNIPLTILLTIGAGVLTAYMAVLLAETRQAPPYPDQGLDVVGVTVGLVFVGLATLALCGASVYVIVWWRRRIREARANR